MEEAHVDVSSNVLTMGPENRFGALLFIEKEGFTALFEKARLAERFDLGIMSSKGQSVVASRHLADELCGTFDIPLLVLRDLDISGFSIANSLQNDGRRYEFANQLRVIDLGLRLTDVEQFSLQSEPVSCSTSAAKTLAIHGATEAEIEFLTSGRRVELNAFTSADFVRFIEEKLRQAGIKKVVPPADVLEAAYRQALQARIVESGLPSLLTKAKARARAAQAPRDFLTLVKNSLDANPAQAWDEAVSDLARAHQF